MAPYCNNISDKEEKLYNINTSSVCYKTSAPLMLLLNKLRLCYWQSCQWKTLAVFHCNISDKEEKLCNINTSSMCYKTFSAPLMLLLNKLRLCYWRYCQWKTLAVLNCNISVEEEKF